MMIQLALYMVVTGPGYDDVACLIYAGNMTWL